MNRKERRLKRQFNRRKKMAIRREVKECKIAIDRIINSEHIPFIKLALGVATVAAWHRQVDIIAAQSYYLDGGLLFGHPVVMKDMKEIKEPIVFGDFNDIGRLV